MNNPSDAEYGVSDYILWFIFGQKQIEAVVKQPTFCRSPEILAICLLGLEFLKR